MAGAYGRGASVVPRSAPLYGDRTRDAARAPGYQWSPAAVWAIGMQAIRRPDRAYEARRSIKLL